MRIHRENALDHLPRLLPAHRPIVVAIAGPTGSGKSTLARDLAAHTSRALVIGTDSYLPDYAELEPHEYDLPEHSHLDELAMHLGALLRGEGVEIPVWSFQEHRRTGHTRLDAQPIVSVEGSHAVQPQIASLASELALIEAAAEDRLARAIARELSGARGWEIDAMTQFIQNIADPTFERFLQYYRRRAHVVIDNPGRTPTDPHDAD